jgi:hypothetical protein
MMGKEYSTNREEEEFMHDICGKARRKEASRKTKTWMGEYMGLHKMLGNS